MVVVVVVVVVGVCVRVLPISGMLRQEDFEWQLCLDYILRLGLKVKTFGRGTGSEIQMPSMNEALGSSVCCTANSEEHV